MKSRDSVAFVIPCFNEEITIESVVLECRARLPRAEIYVFDNNSTDRTAQRARQAGAQVVASKRQGKGQVIRHAFSILEEDVLIILDGDGTYCADLAPRMYAAVVQERYDMVVCNRRTHAGSKAYPRFHGLGNRLFSWFVGFLLGQKVSDVFSGYRAVSRDFYESLTLDSNGFEIESELTLKAVSQGFSVKEIEGPYSSRPEGSHSKLRTFHDGFRILKFIFFVLRDCRPLPFFAGAGLVCFLLSLWAGAAPIADYVREHFVHTVPRAILAAGLMVLSTVLFGVGLILDSQIRHLREQSKLMRRWLRSQQRASEAANQEAWPPQKRAS